MEITARYIKHGLDLEILDQLGQGSANDGGLLQRGAFTANGLRASPGVSVVVVFEYRHSQFSPFRALIQIQVQAPIDWRQPRSVTLKCVPEWMQMLIHAALILIVGLDSGELSGDLLSIVSGRRRFASAFSPRPRFFQGA
jgi:hypothetical protein